MAQSDRQDEPGRVPLLLSVRGMSGELVAKLVVGSQATVENLKMQLEGFVGTAMDNQTLLLAGRALENDATLASVGMVDGAQITLVQCSPQLAGATSLRGLERLVADDVALSMAIDAYKDVMQYTVEEISDIVGAVVAAFNAQDESLALQILDSLPLHLLSEQFDPEVRQLSFFSATSTTCDQKTDSWYDSEDPTRSGGTDAVKPEHSTSYFELDVDSPMVGQQSREARRERFTQCVRAALEMILFAIEQRGVRFFDAL